MDNNKEIFSVRIVVADFYLTRPIRDLDPVYSKFRGREIKKVPVIRIFGNNANGERVCMHVHGVLPYFYVPYEKTKLGKIEQVTHQIAAGIDKAINISLGQANSQTSHIYEIQLVKGIPLYGYHHKEHQFLKIFLYNPRFIKRVANLFQNGAILGKIFQPHEAHIPFVLQFLIDYNLHGMDFLHVPKDILKRRKENLKNLNDSSQKSEEIYENIPEKISISKHEIDINAVFILNRFQLMNRNVNNANPGIESIWQDEKFRREKLMKISDKDIPKLEISLSQERSEVKSTNSEIFYKSILKNKIQNETKIVDESMNTTVCDSPYTQTKQKELIFNLKKLLMNSVYPEECSQQLENTLSNASMIQPYLPASTTEIPKKSRKKRSLKSSIENNETDTSVPEVDEKLIMILSQNKSAKHNQTLLPEDVEILDVLQELEEDDENVVDLDSTLAPLTPLSPANSNKSQKTILSGNSTQEESHETNFVNICEDTGDPEDNEEINFFENTLTSESIDKLMLQLRDEDESNDVRIPQFDGMSDEILLASKRSVSSTSKFLKSKRSFKYNPLQITVGSLPTKENEQTIVISDDDDIIYVSSSDESSNATTNLIKRKQRLKTISPRKKLLLGKVNQSKLRKKLNFDNEVIDKEIANNISDIISSDRQVNVEQEKQNTSLNMFRLKRCQIKLKRLKRSYITSLTKTINNNRNNFLLSDNISVATSYSSTPSPITTRTQYSPSDVAREYDRRNNFFPEPGPSHINYYKLIEVPNPEIQNITKNTNKNSENNGQLQNGQNLNEINNDDNEMFNDSRGIEHFHEQSYLLDSPSMFGSMSSQMNYSNSDVGDYIRRKPSTDAISVSSSTSSFNLHLSNSPIITNDNNSLITIKLKELPPTFHDVLNNLKKYNIPKVIHQKPFYSSKQDVKLFSSSKKEVGRKILQIPGNTLNDCDEFQSQIPELKGLNELRRKLLNSMLPKEQQNKNLQILKTDYHIKEYFCNEDNITISPKNLPPTHDDAILWYKDLQKDKITLTKHDQISKKSKKLAKLNEETDKIKNCNSIDMNNHINESSSNNSSNETSPSHSHQSTEEVLKKSSIGINTKMNVSSKSSGKISLKEFLKEINVPDKRLKRIPYVKLNNLNKTFKKNAYCQKNKPSISTVRNSDNIDVKNHSFEKSFNENISSSISINDFSNKIPNRESLSFDKSFGLTGPTLENTFGFKFNLDNLKSVKTDIEQNLLTVLSLEIFVPTKGELKPNPEFDPIQCLFYSIITNDDKLDENNFENSSSSTKENITNEKYISGYIMIAPNDKHSINDNSKKLLHCKTNEITICKVQNEVELFSELIKLCYKYDPDIFVGYEIEMNSWGYVIDRGKQLNLNLLFQLSRVPYQKSSKYEEEKLNAINEEEKEQLRDIDFDIEIKLTGRISLNLWRLMRSEIALTSYTFENAMYHVLHRRIPLHSFSNLTNWYQSTKHQWIVIDYYMERVLGNLQLLDKLDIIGKTAEMAKLIGIQFYEVLSRGSQYRVESMLLRLAKPRNYVPISPSIQQRAHMKAPEYLPLILEPESALYADPLIVLDFQSLYPSMIIAYNYCFSTCLGRVEHLGNLTSQPFEFGASQLKVSPKYLKYLLENDLVNISPCGVVFVKPEVREGVLPRMLKEILNTRLMVKQSMKLHKGNSTLQRVLHSRQLALKLVANVTYGYTAANFSGRMPCVEIGDSVVSKGRETLERAIKFVEENNKKWSAKVIYGDTDSLFVLCPNQTREYAFEIGEKIANFVTNDNPKPVKLKLEKVYQPSILQTKKRYVGYLYESAEQENPVYEAKGIETIRRDGCPAVVKILERTIRILFDTRDVSKVKNFVCRQFTKILTGRINVQDLIFAKEFRGLNDYKSGACVPSLELARKWIKIDPRSEPRRGERVPFLIINGPPNVPLIRLVRSPYEFLTNDGLQINALYYITRAIIPPLNRCLLLIGADANEWFNEMPRKHFPLSILPTSIVPQTIKNNFENCNNNKKKIISHFFTSKNCIINCGKQTSNKVCSDCITNPRKCVVTLSDKISVIDREYHMVKKVCESCCRRCENIKCLSLDCSVLFIMNQKQRNHDQINCLKQILDEF